MMLSSNESEEGITDVYFVRFDFFFKDEYDEVTSYLSSQYSNKGSEYEDHYGVGHTRRGEYFTYNGDSSVSELFPFSSISTYLKKEISVGTYHVKPLEEVYYLITVAHLSENEIDALQGDTSSQSQLVDWREEVKEFIKNPSIIEIKQEEIPTHTILRFSGNNPFTLLDQSRLKEKVPKWITEYNRKTSPRFFKFGYDSRKPCSLLDQAMIISAGATPLDSLFGVYLPPGNPTNHTEPAMLASLDHIVRRTLIIYPGMWRINQIKEHQSKIDELPEFDEKSKNYTEEIQKLNKLEDNWEDIHNPVNDELEEFKELIAIIKSDISFVRFQEISIQKWNRRHLAVENEFNGYTILKILDAYAAINTNNLQGRLEEVDTHQRRKSDIVDTRINRESHLQESHWINRPLVKVVGFIAAIITILGLIRRIVGDLSLYQIVGQIQGYLHTIPIEIHLIALTLMILLILGLLRYNPLRLITNQKSR